MLRLKTATRCVHHETDEDPFGAVVPPFYQTATFANRRPWSLESMTTSQAGKECAPTLVKARLRFAKYELPLLVALESCTPSPLLRRSALTCFWLKANLTTRCLWRTDKLPDRFEDRLNLLIVCGYVSLQRIQLVSELAVRGEHFP